MLRINELDSLVIKGVLATKSSLQSLATRAPWSIELVNAIREISDINKIRQLR